ncbi:MAG: hypothetical protein A2Y25_11785 [Candidatus Melainabacteria bacterium GWF2_37_15]|nr:MAG: hypothetical protein A2Y25_11785 [Candidatus Melainabacteria bacterium GWF2_37_15]
MNYEFIANVLAGCFPVFDADIVVRLIVSLLLGLLIGLEREMTNKSAGLRTHILVCLGSTVFTILSIYGFNCVNSGFSDGDAIRIVHDPSRIAAQIVTGIGFIGGGAVLHYGMNIFGLTTAATLWITASIGMAVGAGSYPLAILATAFTFLVLVVIRQIENRFLPRGISKGGRVKVSVSCAKEAQATVQEWFYREFKNIQEISASRMHDEKANVKLAFVLECVGKDPVNVIYGKLSSLENVESISVKQILV